MQGLPGLIDQRPQIAGVGWFQAHPNAHSDMNDVLLCPDFQQLDLMAKLWRAVNRWRSAWEPKAGAPREDLRAEKWGRSCRVIDTRRVTGRRKRFTLPQDETLELLSARPASGAEREAWAVERKLGVIVDGWYVPLAIPDAQLLACLVERRGAGEGPPANPLVRLERLAAVEEPLQRDTKSCEATAQGCTP